MGYESLPGEPMSIEAYDAREQDERHRRADRKHKIAMERYALLGTIVIALSVVAVIIGGMYFLWAAFRGPSTEDTQRQEARMACIDKGGVWLATGESDDNSFGDGSGFGTCAFGVATQ